ncbi:TOMM precursor leader peptide-binding protein [Bacillus thuringiensis]|uniref:TOMM precursor leader peptide-binding protein n=2 Tax=Bacillus thuringiensis TaxID=1428 RepID=UPI003CF0F04E
MMKKCVAVIGEGFFAKETKSFLEKKKIEVFQVNSISELNNDLSSFNAVLSCSDEKNIKEDIFIQQSAVEHKKPFLRCTIDMEKILIGPWVIPEENVGCVSCCEQRFVVAHPQKEILRRKSEEFLEIKNENNLKMDSVTGLFFATIIHNQLELYFQGQKKDMLINAVYVGNQENSHGERHSFLQNPLCATCNLLPEDSPELATINFKEIYKSEERTYRLDNPLLNLEKLRNLYVDYRTGLITHIYRNQIKTRWMPFVVAEMPLFEGDVIEYGSGRTYNFYDSEKSSILEALERYVGMHPRRTKTVIHGSYKQLKDKAFDPKKLTLHDKSQYEEPGYGYIPYSDDLEYNWCWVYSWKEKAPVLLPETMIYYRLLNDNSKPRNRFVYETSNGCALGNSIEEAIFYGLLEVIERDAFLVSWYTKRPLTRINLEDVEDKNLLIITELIEAEGYDIHIFDTTMETGIPSVWVMMINPKENAPVKTYSAAGAHPNPEKAILGALVEVTTSFAIYEEVFLKDREKAAEMVSDSGKVQVMDDHVLLYSHPETLERFSFLFTEESKTKNIRECYKSWYEEEPSMNFTREVKHLLNVVSDTFGDILIVNQTSSELEKSNLKAVKVFVEGMLTMSFGHQYRRINLKRIQQGENFFRQAVTIQTMDDVNLDPHPFP